jgi:hypothetical protein
LLRVSGTGQAEYVCQAVFSYPALHLPYASTRVDFAPLVTYKAVLLNSLAGVAYGWLYWRAAAMVAHALTHVAMTLVAILFLR